MTVPAALDALVASTRSIRWSPIALAPLVGAGGLLAMRALGGGAWEQRGMVAMPALTMVALSFAFVVDDPVTVAAPATPAGLRHRLLRRLAVAVPVALAGWLALWFAAQPLPGSLGSSARFDAAAAIAGVAAAAIAGRRWPHGSPGAIGAAGVTAVLVLSAALPRDLRAWLPPSLPLQLALVAIGALTVVVTTREPSP